MTNVNDAKLKELLTIFVDQTTECPPIYNPNDSRYDEDKICPYLISDNVLCENCWCSYLASN